MTLLWYGSLREREHCQQKFTENSALYICRESCCDDEAEDHRYGVMMKGVDDAQPLSGKIYYLY
jgi:hypothetical protein